MSVWAQDNEGILRLPFGLEGGGFAIVPYNNRRITIELPPAKIELILVLNAALAADQHLDEPARGWRSPGDIAADMAYRKEDYSVRRATAEINRIFREAAAKVSPREKPPRLLSTKPRIGIRLSLPFRIDGPSA